MNFDALTLHPACVTTFRLSDYRTSRNKTNEVHKKHSVPGCHYAFNCFTAFLCLTSYYAITTNIKTFRKEFNEIESKNTIKAVSFFYARVKNVFSA